jgi:uncharacterized membrane protein
MAAELDEKKPAAPSGPLTLEEFRKRYRSPHTTFRDGGGKKVGLLARMAVWITDRVGTMGFFLIIFTWTVVWLGWNLLAPKDLQFDPPMGFVLWLFISNLIQILLMPLIMLGQNIQGQHAERRAQYDLDVNVKAEQEIEAILYHLEYQNSILIALLKKQGIGLDEALGKKPE